MLQPPPARPGMREDEVDTPALLIDLDAFEYNLNHMAELLAPTGAKLRAHAKTHKSPVIQAADGPRGCRAVCAKGGGSRGACMGRHPRYPGKQRGGGCDETGAARCTGADQQSRGVRRRCVAGDEYRGSSRECRSAAASAGGD